MEIDTIIDNVKFNLLGVIGQLDDVRNGKIEKSESEINQLIGKRKAYLIILLSIADSLKK